MTQPPIITLLTDFGLADHYVAAMKGVILGICPEARLIDITHEIRAYAIADAAFTLAQAAPCFPAGTIHLVVVDPGVGSARRPLLVDAAGHRFVAPDNGVLSPILQPHHSPIREITATRYFRQPPSQTFHGRDIFAPVAAHLANGIPPADFGPLIEDPVRLPAPESAGQILHVDRYGNLVTNLPLIEFADLSTRPFQLEIGAAIVSQTYPSYASAPANKLFLIPGSSGYWEISITQASAAAETGAATGAPFTLTYRQSSYLQSSYLQS
jgi:S-adenosylmethionine hydrolase